MPSATTTKSKQSASKSAAPSKVIAPVKRRSFAPRIPKTIPDASVSFVDAAPWLAKGPALAVFSMLRSIAKNGKISILRSDLAGKLNMSERNVSRGISSLLAAKALKRGSKLDQTKYEIIAKFD